jgi:dihydrofolate reductase
MMANLIYSGIMSLDGYVVDANGNFEWAAPDEEVHAFVNDLEREIGTYLYGRRMYDVMSVWQSWDTTDEPAVVSDYAEIWRAADKVVFSGTLDVAPTPKTTLVDTLDPASIRALKSSAEKNLSIGGPTLAAAAITAGLVDEFHLLIHPVAVGGGTPFLPAGAHLQLELVDERRFESGVVHLHYRDIGVSDTEATT